MNRKDNTSLDGDLNAELKVTVYICQCMRGGAQRMYTGFKSVDCAMLFIFICVDDELLLKLK